jgi:hypothetical protein
MATRARSKTEVDDSQRRLAVLIDADNAQPAVIESLLAEIAKFGVASVKRIYGDWTSPSHGQWKKALLGHSISPVQQFAYTRGKNSTDSSLIIDAMDLMYTRRFDGFCLVSSDSDFTRLAQRLREEGLLVLGFGEKKTPESFVAACDKFVYTEVLRPGSAKDEAARSVPAGKPAKPKAPAPARARDTEPAAPAPVASGPQALPVDLIKRAIEDSSDESGWAPLGPVGSYLTKIRPDFDPRLYGQRKLSDLLRKHPALFALEERSLPGGTGKAIYVRASS